MMCLARGSSRRETALNDCRRVMERVPVRAGGAVPDGLLAASGERSYYRCTLPSFHSGAEVGVRGCHGAWAQGAGGHLEGTFALYGLLAPNLLLHRHGCRFVRGAGSL